MSLSNIENRALQQYIEMNGISSEFMEMMLLNGKEREEKGISDNNFSKQLLATLSHSPKSCLTHHQLVDQRLSRAFDEYTSVKVTLPSDYPVLSNLHFKKQSGSISDLLVDLKVIDKKSLKSVRDLHRESLIKAGYVKGLVDNLAELSMVFEFGRLTKHNITTVYTRQFELKIFRRAAQLFDMPAFNSYKEFVNLYFGTSVEYSDIDFDTFASGFNNTELINASLNFYYYLVHHNQSLKLTMADMTDEQHDIFELCSYIIAVFPENQFSAYELSGSIDEPNLIKFRNEQCLSTLAEWKLGKKILDNPWLRSKLIETEIAIHSLNKKLETEEAGTLCQHKVRNFVIYYLCNFLKNSENQDPIKHLSALYQAKYEALYTQWFDDISASIENIVAVTEDTGDILSNEANKIISALITKFEEFRSKFLCVDEYAQFGDGYDQLHNLKLNTCKLKEHITEILTRRKVILTQIGISVANQNITSVINMTDELNQAKDMFNQQFIDIGTEAHDNLLSAIELIDNLESNEATSLYNSADETDAILVLAKQEYKDLEEKFKRLNVTQQSLLAENEALKNQVVTNNAGISESMSLCLFGNPSITDVISVITEQYPFVVLADDFSKTVSDCQYANPKKLLEILYRLCGEYFPAIEAGRPDSECKEYLHGCYAPRESHSTSNNKRLAQQRMFRFNGESIYQAQHITLGGSPDPRKTVQVFFDISDHQLRIGYIGAHLSTSSIKH